MPTLWRAVRHSVLVRPVTTVYLCSALVLVLVSQRVITLTTGILADSFVCLSVVVLAVRAEVARVRAEHLQLLVVLKDEGIAESIPLPDNVAPAERTTPHE